VSRPECDVRLLRAAEDDLAEILTYIASDRAAAAENLADRFEKDLGLLSRNPNLGRVPKEEELAGLGYRYLVVENYLVFYVVEGAAILVHRILHGARDYSRLF
jgi:toxin ParE1/3/4